MDTNSTKPDSDDKGSRIDYFSPTVVTVEDVISRDFSPHQVSPVAQTRPRPELKRGSVVSFSSQHMLRPQMKSRLGTHRPDHSDTNLAEVLHNSGGSEGLKDIDIDYFRTVIDIFKDKQNHESPVVLDFMLLHQVNIHHLEHRLVAEWDWLVNALSQDASEKDLFANQAPQRLDEIRELLHKYSVALKDFEEMRKRTTMDENKSPLRQSSWHSRLTRVGSALHHHEKHGEGPLRRMYSAFRRASIAPDAESHGAPQLVNDRRTPTGLFSTTSPSCRQLAGVEGWKREYDRRELDEKSRQEAIRREKLANRLRRFSMAAFAGIALISPMVLMTLVPTLKCALSTTSLATLLFAVVIAYFTEITDKDIVVATAGYAAVLVVFVGTSTSLSSH